MKRSIFMATLIFLAIRPAWAGEGDLERRFRSEGISSLARLERLTENVSCRAYRRSPYGKFEANTEYAVLGDSKLEVRRFVPGKSGVERGAAAVRGRTSRTAFRLKQDTPDAPFLVEFYGTDAPDIQRTNLHMIVHLDVFVRSATQLYDLPVTRLVADPHFKIAGIEQVGPGREPLVEIAFTLDGSKLWYKRGRMRLDPSRSWAVRGYEVYANDMKGEETCDSGVIEYGPWPGGAVFPRKVHIERKRVLGDPKDTAVEEAAFEEVSFGSTSPERFELSSFGISDLPARRGAGPLGIWVWASSMCAAAGALSLIARRYHRPT